MTLLRDSQNSLLQMAWNRLIMCAKRTHWLWLYCYYDSLLFFSFSQFLPRIYGIVYIFSLRAKHSIDLNIFTSFFQPIQWDLSQCNSLNSESHGFTQILWILLLHNVYVRVRMMMVFGKLRLTEHIGRVSFTTSTTTKATKMVINGWY